MRYIWSRTGQVLYWLLLPAIIVVTRFTTRSRVLLVCGSKVLVVNSWLGDGRWELPGGGLHRGEDPAAGALRELREETGLSVALEQLGKPEKRLHTAQGRRYPYYLVTAELSEVLPLRRRKLELTDAAWIEMEELTAHNAGQDVLDALATWKALA